MRYRRLQGISHEAGSGYEVRLLNQDGKEVSRATGAIVAEEYAMPALKAHESPGIYALGFRLDGQIKGAHPLLVESELPLSSPVLCSLIRGDFP